MHLNIVEIFYFVGASNFSFFYPNLTTLTYFMLQHSFTGLLCTLEWKTGKWEVLPLFYVKSQTYKFHVEVTLELTSRIFLIAKSNSDLTNFYVYYLVRFLREIGFYEIQLAWIVDFIFHSIVWKNEKFSLTEKIFREINSSISTLIKTLLSRNFCQKSEREFPKSIFCFKNFTWNQFRFTRILQFAFHSKFSSK